MGIRLLLKHPKQLVLGHNHTLKVFCQIFWTSDTLVKLHLSRAPSHFFYQARNFTIALTLSSFNLPSSRRFVQFFLVRLKVVIMVNQKLQFVLQMLRLDVHRHRKFFYRPPGTLFDLKMDFYRLRLWQMRLEQWDDLMKLDPLNCVAKHSLKRWV